MVILSAIKGILGEADCRGGEQLQGAVAARTGHCSTDSVYVCVTFVLIPNPFEQN